MAEKINLSTAVRTSLLLLQQNTRLTGRTQERLASGLKVNSAADDASAFFTARAFTNRASDLAGLKENIDLGVSTIQTAIQGIDAITELVEQAKGLAISAKATGDTSERSLLAVQFNALLNQIDDLANDSSFNGINLLQATPDNLIIEFNESGSSDITITGLDSTSGAAGLDVSVAAGDFAADANIDAALSDVNNALTELRTNASTLGSNSSILQSRLRFTEKLVNTLEEGAGKLTLADLNEESANLLALQTRGQLATNSLALSAQNERAILSLFG